MPPNALTPAPDAAVDDGINSGVSVTGSNNAFCGNNISATGGGAVNITFTTHTQRITQRITQVVAAPPPAPAQAPPPPTEMPAADIAKARRCTVLLGILDRSRPSRIEWGSGAVVSAVSVTGFPSSCAMAMLAMSVSAPASQSSTTASPLPPDVPLIFSVDTRCVSVMVMVNAGVCRLAAVTVAPTRLP